MIIITETEPNIDLDKLIEDIPEKDMRKLLQALKDMEEIGKEGADQLTQLFEKTGSSAAFAVPLQILLSRLSSHPEVIESFNELMEIIRSPGLSTIIQLVAGAMGQFITFLTGIVGTFTSIGDLLVALYKLIKGDYRGETVVVDPPIDVMVKTTGPFWWLEWILRVFGAR